MKKLVYLSFLFTTLFLSCKDKWDDHYNANLESKDSIVSSLNLLDYLKTQPQYSKYLEVLEKTGVAQELSRDQYLTVWVVDNEAMAGLESMGMTDTFIIKYHINYLKFTFDKLKDGMRLKALNNKYIPIKTNDVGDLTMDNVGLKKANQICKNGVVHELTQLMRPLISIYEYVESLDNGYSTIRDSILSRNDTVFDKANSIPKGVDKYGNTVYDSAFTITNPILDTVNIRSEFNQVTMFLPNNSVISQCIGDLKDQYQKIGKTFAHSDSMMAFNWIKRAIFYNTKIENYGATTDITSAFKKVWRTTVQKVNPEPREMSNGLIYYVTFMKIPTNVYLTRIKSLVYYYQYLTAEQKTQYYTLYNDSTVASLILTGDSYSFPNLNNLAGNYMLLNPKGYKRDGKKLAVEFNPVMLVTNPDGTQTAKLMEVPVGEYSLYMGFLSKDHAYVNIYFNGLAISSNLNVTASSPWNYDRVNSTAVGTDGKSTKWDGLGGMVGTVKVEKDPNFPDKYINTFKIKVEFEKLSNTTKSEELRIYHWALLPSSNNY
jgi:hypothetical protein